MSTCARILQRLFSNKRSLLGIHPEREYSSKQKPLASGNNFCMRQTCHKELEVGMKRRYYHSSSSLMSSSVSQSEISKFSKLSSTWWDPNHNPLVAMNPVRVEFVVDHVTRNLLRQRRGLESDANLQGSDLPLAALDVLDVGCGGGLLAESMARLGGKVTAIDPSTALIDQAMRHAQLNPVTQSIDYRGGWTVEQLADEQRPPTFDVICLSEVIEHVTDMDSVLEAAASLLKKPNGLLFVSTLNRTIKSKLLAIVGAEYITGWVPQGTHDWNQFRSPSEVQGLVCRVDLEQMDVNGMVVEIPPLLTGKWKWSLNPVDTDMNWIGVYRHASKE